MSSNQAAWPLLFCNWEVTKNFTFLSEYQKWSAFFMFHDKYYVLWNKSLMEGNL